MAWATAASQGIQNNDPATMNIAQMLFGSNAAIQSAKGALYRPFISLGTHTNY
jgi:hypothetical protein